MMNSGKIQAKVESKIIDYSGEELKFIFEKRIIENRNKSFNDNSILISEFMDSIIENDVIIIYSKEIANDEMIKKIIETVENRLVRIYILVEKNNSKLKKLYGKVLIRRATTLSNSSFIIKKSNGRQSGILLNMPFNNSSLNESYCLNLDSLQAKKMIRLFQKSFWDSAIEEILEESGEVKEPFSPFAKVEMMERFYSKEDIIEHFQDFCQSYEELYSVFNADYNYDDLCNSTLLLNKNDLEHMTKIKALSEKGNKIFLTKNKLLYNTYFNEEGYFISDFGLHENSFSIPMNDEQLGEMIDTFNIELDASQYQFFNKKKVADIEHSFFYDNENDLQKVSDVEDVQLKDIEAADIDEFIGYNINDKIDQLAEFKTSLPALSYNYTLKVLPPLLSVKAERAKLVKDWEKIKGDVSVKNNILSDKLEEYLSKLEKKNFFFFNIFKINESRNLKKGIKEVKDIRDKDIRFLSISEREKMLEKINEIIGLYNKGKTVFADKVDEDRQNKVWKDRKEEFEKEKEKIKKSIRESERKNADKDAEITEKTISIYKSKRESIFERYKEYNDKKILQLQKDIGLENLVDSNIEELKKKLTDQLHNFNQDRLNNEQLKEKIKELENKIPNLEASKMELCKSEYSVQSDKIKLSLKEIEDKITKCIDKIEYLSKKKWNKKNKRNLKKAEKEREDLTNQRSKLEKDDIALKELQELEKDDKDQAEKVSELENTITIKKEKLVSVKSALKLSNQLNKIDQFLDESIKNKETITKLEVNTKSLDNLIEYLKKISFLELKKMIKELNKQNSGFKREQQELNRNLDVNKKNLISKDDELSKHGSKFVYVAKEKDRSGLDHLKKNSSKNSKNSFLTELAISFPDEQINCIGDLYEYQNKRFLKIETYDDLDEAREEADRLNAKICI